MANRRRVLTSHAMHLVAPPEKVFPLLCPVREYDWIETWKCDVVFTRSGFTQRAADAGKPGTSRTRLLSTDLDGDKPPICIEPLCFELGPTPREALSNAEGNMAELLEGVELRGVAAYLGDAADSKVTLFV